MNRQMKINIITALLTVVVGLVVGMIIIAIIGSNPWSLLNAIYEGTFGSVVNFGNWISISVPLALTGLAVAIGYRAGLFNIGAEGQFQMATIASILVAVTSPFNGLITILLVIIVGIIVGALWALIPGILKAYYKINEVVVTIMMNWIALYLTNYFIVAHFHTSTNLTQTPIIPSTVSLNLKWLTNLTNGSNINAGIFILMLAAIFYWYSVEKTTFGYEIKAVGNSSEAAIYAGIDSKKRIIQTMCLSGAFAGLAGVVYALSAPGYQTTLSVFRGFGFDGITVALLGQLSAIGVILSGLLLGGLRQAGIFMQIQQIPKEISDIIIGVILIFSALSPIIIKKIMKKKGDANE